jgi:hypothetical protein
MEVADDEEQCGGRERGRAKVAWEEEGKGKGREPSAPDKAPPAWVAAATGACALSAVSAVTTRRLGRWQVIWARSPARVVRNRRGALTSGPDPVKYFQISKLQSNMQIRKVSISLL